MKRLLCCILLLVLCTACAGTKAAPPPTPVPTPYVMSDREAALAEALTALIPDSFRGEGTSLTVIEREGKDHVDLTMEYDFFTYPQECAYSAYFFMQTVLDTKDALPEHAIESYAFRFLAKGEATYSAEFMMENAQAEPLRVVDAAGDVKEYSIEGFQRYQMMELVAGRDLPVGEYNVYGGDLSSYSVYESESAQEPLYTVQFRYRDIVTLTEGQCIDLAEVGVILHAYDMPVGLDLPVYPDGMYKVGEDIPAGSYTLHVGGERKLTYAVTRDSLHLPDSVLQEGEIEEDEAIELAEGTYVRVFGGSLRKPDAGGADDAP